jgi:hypothetical protein
MHEVIAWTNLASFDMQVEEIDAQHVVILSGAGSRGASLSGCAFRSCPPSTVVLRTWHRPHVSTLRFALKAPSCIFFPKDIIRWTPVDLVRKSFHWARNELLGKSGGGAGGRGGVCVCVCVCVCVYPRLEQAMLGLVLFLYMWCPCVNFSPLQFAYLWNGERVK